MLRKALWAPLGAVVLLVGVGSVATAQQTKTFKHDQYSSNIYEAVNQVNGQLLQNEPGFVYGEAFGAMFRPTTPDYPMKMLGVDVIFGGPAAEILQSTTIDIEVYANAGSGPEPANPTPDYVISSTDFWNPDTNDFGIPIKGKTAYQFDFSYDDPQYSPPLITQGNVIVMLRFKQQAMSLEEEWSTLQCLKFTELQACGCQPVSMILDGNGLSPQTNIMNIIWPLGTCTGQKAWKYFDNITLGTKKLGGDVILRLRVESSDPGCVGSCAGKECGDDGCGAPCGFCDDGELCDAGTCVSDCEPSCADKACGDDGCGGMCGVCAGGETCQDGACVPTCTPDCGGKECGDDGCGGSCGACSGEDVCQDGACVPPDVTCTPECDDRACGDDGCGGTCGTCADDEICTVDGQCEAEDPGPVTPGDELTITKVDPGAGSAGQDTVVSILGGGFTSGITARLGGAELMPLQVVNESLISATVPKTLEVGVYTLILSDDQGRTAFLDAAFEVREAAATCGDGTCDPGESCATCPSDCGGQCPDVGSGRGAPAGGCDMGHGPSSTAGFWLLGLLLLGVLRFAFRQARR